MPDTQPITQSFPWLTKRYRPVFNNENIVGSVSLANAGFQGTGGAFQPSPAFQTGSTVKSPGDLYRYI